MAGIPIVCAVSAPSSLAVDAGRRFGMTLVGFLRGSRFNIYTHAERITSNRTGQAPVSVPPSRISARFCTNWKPNRPLTQRLPLVTSWSSGEVTLTIVVVLDVQRQIAADAAVGADRVASASGADSSQVPAARWSCSLLNMSAPVGQTAMQLPQ